MTIVLPSHDEELYPIHLGHVLRTPSDDWRKYGIKWETGEEFQRLVEWGRMEYMREWSQGDPSQIEIVAEASRKAFGGNDNNQLLRERTGEVVATHLMMQQDSGGRVFYVLDVGAGAGDSFLAVLDKLPGDFKGEVHGVLLDPSPNSLAAAGQKVEERWVKYTLLEGRQDQIPELFAKHLDGQKMSAVMQVASIHHDSDIPFQNFYGVTEDGGIIASGDWHPRAWQEPAYVLKMLETNWPEYGLAIEDFMRTYGVIKSRLPADPEARKACEDIFRFWKAYHEGLVEKGRGHGSNSIWPLEAHQDFRRYLEKMEKAGYSVQAESYLGELLQATGTGNPHQFYEDSTVIMGTYGHKMPSRN